MQTSISAPRAAFSLEGVGFAIKERPLLHPLTLDLPAGKVTGLIGHNGSGKSTLLKILARQQAATQGRAYFEGRAVDEWSDRAFARKVAYLPQQAPVATGMTTRELVALGRYPWHGALGRFGHENRNRITEALELTDTMRFADRQVETLSGGERQRVWLAMLVAQDADCLLLDEPISALDIAHQIEVLALVRRLGTEKNRAVIIVLHEVNMAARFCDEILALKGGRLVARGTPGEIMTPGRLHEIYGIAMTVIPHPQTGSVLGFPM